MPVEDTVYVRISEAERQFLDAIAESSLRSRNAVIRTLVQRAMAMTQEELSSLFGAGVKGRPAGEKEAE